MRAIVLDHFGGLDSLVIKKFLNQTRNRVKLLFKLRHLELFMPKCTCAAENGQKRHRLAALNASAS
jgi:hypothetical protein